LWWQVVLEVVVLVAAAELVGLELAQDWLLYRELRTQLLLVLAARVEQVPQADLMVAIQFLALSLPMVEVVARVLTTVQMLQKVAVLVVDALQIAAPLERQVKATHHQHHHLKAITVA
jgi:hypothetical protein